ncbi:MAG: D-glycerate dehydrogenase [Acidimicrobiales bacterium]|nr:D-glycerate dehydrogenase [Acidimicrobiales bacterium]
MGEGRARVFVTRDLPGSALSRLRTVAEVDVWPERLPPPPQVLRERAASADGLITLLTDQVDAALLDACPRLRVVANVAVGYDNLDVAELTRRGIPAGNTPGVLTESTAELTWALILGASRRVVEGVNAVLSGEWLTWEPAFLLGQELSGAVLGIVGMGRIGQAVARRARGFDMQVVAWSRQPKPLADLEVRWVELDELLTTSDVVSLHCALTPETHHLIGAPQLARMKPTAVLVNTARGPVVDQPALAEALRANRIAAAGLDVTEEEPIPLDDPLLGLANCLVLPHIGSATIQARSKMADMAVDNVLAGLAGRPLPTCVNPAALRRR